MYEQFFGIQKRPFNLTADPAFLFMTAQHREALAGLSYAILSRKGFVVLTGDAGTGKTTLLCKALRHLPSSRLVSSLILNPALSPAEFLEMALLDFGITEIPGSKAQRLWALQNLLLECRRQDQVAALIVDEAHTLSPEVLEEIRLLGNFEGSDQKLLQIVLIGQPELGGILNQPALRQLKQRIAVRLSISNLSNAEVAPYIAHRWKTAGGEQTPPFSREALNVIAQFSHGIPRLINVICDNALTTAFGGGHQRVEASHVQSALNDLDFTGKLSVRTSGNPAGNPVPASSPSPIRLTNRTAGTTDSQSRPRANRFSGPLGLSQSG